MFQRIAMAVTFLFLTVACATVPTGPLTSGEVRVTEMKIPENVKAGERYDVRLLIQKDEKADIKITEGCFSWQTSWGVEGPYCRSATTAGKEVVSRLITRNRGSYTLWGFLRYTVGGESRRTNEVSGSLVVR